MHFRHDWCQEECSKGEQDIRCNIDNHEQVPKRKSPKHSLCMSSRQAVASEKKTVLTSNWLPIPPNTRHPISTPKMPCSTNGEVNHRQS